MLINLAWSPLLGNINKITPQKVMKSFTKTFITLRVEILIAFIFILVESG